MYSAHVVSDTPTEIAAPLTCRVSPLQKLKARVATKMEGKQNFSDKKKRSQEPTGNGTKKPRIDRGPEKQIMKARDSENKSLAELPIIKRIEKAREKLRLQQEKKKHHPHDGEKKSKPEQSPVEQPGTISRVKKHEKNSSYGKHE